MLKWHSEHLDRSYLFDYGRALSDYRKVVLEMCEFLDLPTAGIKPNTRKLHPEPLSHRVANWTALKHQVPEAWHRWFVKDEAGAQL